LPKENHLVSIHKILCIKDNADVSQRCCAHLRLGVAAHLLFCCLQNIYHRLLTVSCDAHPLLIHFFTPSFIPTFPTDVITSQSVHVVTPIQGVYLVETPTTQMMITRLETFTLLAKIFLLTIMTFQLVVEEISSAVEWVVDENVGIPVGRWLRYHLVPTSFWGRREMLETERAE
jgi:hypothetical protein